jgi:hypothetical protein
MSETSLAEEKPEIKGPVLSRRGRLLGGLFISLLTIVIMLGGIELVGYTWEKKLAQGPQGWTLVGSRRLELEWHGSAEQPYYLFRPGSEYLWEGIPVQINSHGLRTEEVALPKPAGTYRVLNIGDSVPFGWRVEQAESYGKLLEQEWRAAGVAGGEVEVVNAAVPGWSLEAARNFLLQEGFDYQPDGIILSITLVNDITDAPVVRPENALFNWLRDNTYSWPFLSTQAQYLKAGQVGPEAIPALNPPQEARRYYPLREDHELYERVWGYIAEMAEASEERGIPFLVVIFPTAFQVNSAAHPLVPQQVLGGRAAEAGINSLDLTPAFQEACEAAGPDACEGYINALFGDVWMHPNAAGHRLAAEEIRAVWLLP